MRDEDCMIKYTETLHKLGILTTSELLNVYFALMDRLMKDVVDE